MGTEGGPRRGGRRPGPACWVSGPLGWSVQAQVQNTKINSVVQLSRLRQFVRAGQWLFPPGPVLSVQSSHNVGSRACGGEWPSIGWNQRARWAALELELEPCQGLASRWGGPGAAQVSKSRHWLTLDEAGPLLLLLTYRSRGLWAEGAHSGLEELTPGRPGRGPHPVLPTPRSREPFCRHIHTPVLHGAGLLGSALIASISEFLLLLLPQLHVQLIACL